MTANTTTVLPDARARLTTIAEGGCIFSAYGVELDVAAEMRLDLAAILATQPTPNAAVQAGAWRSPDLRDMHADIERLRSHDLGGQRLRDLLLGAMDMLRAADAELAS